MTTKNLFRLFSVSTAVCLLLAIQAPAWAARPVDNDGDGFKSNQDCDDNDATIYPGAPEVCFDGTDNNCNGVIDEGCSDPPPPTGYHDSLAWNGPGTCLECHALQAEEVHGSVHIQWEGDAPFMSTGPARQGKYVGAVNSYCINITGNWGGCSSCHAGLGAEPEPTATQAQLENVDCMICHQEAYKRTKVNGVFVPDTANMSITMDQAVQTVHVPKRTTCVNCHAKGGGGDNYKRGDIALAHGTTADTSFDVHMATAGGDLACQDCHATQNHLMAGRGSDLRVTENMAEIGCATSGCHTVKATNVGHTTDDVNRHVDRVACQSCHIARYAKDASDTAATEATEMFRSWLEPHPTPSGAIHPGNIMLNDQVPEYRFWNKTSWAYNLYDPATIDPATGRYPTSRPHGTIADTDTKLYPFKYKTAEQPYADNLGILIALDTSLYFATGDPVTSTEQGLVNMGYSTAEPYSWVETDTYQLITHEVAPAAEVLQCADCHESSATQMQLVAELGYGLKDTEAVVCSQCHQQKRAKPYDRMHDRHVSIQQFDCSWCHTFSRPERGLGMP